MCFRYFKNDATFNLKEAIETNHKFGENCTFIQGILTEVVDTKVIKIKRTDNLDNADGLDQRADEIINYDYLGKITVTREYLDSASFKILCSHQQNLKRLNLQV
jgi:hypothetical protein